MKFKQYLNEAKIKFPEGSEVTNKRTGMKYKVIENNGKGGIYCRKLEDVKKGITKGDWFKETDMK